MKYLALLTLFFSILISGCHSINKTSSPLKWAVAEKHRVEQVVRERIKGKQTLPQAYNPETNIEFAKKLNRYQLLQTQLEAMLRKFEEEQFNNPHSRIHHMHHQEIETLLLDLPEYKKIKEESLILKAELAPYYAAKKKHRNLHEQITMLAIKRCADEYDLIINQFGHDDILHAKNPDKINITLRVIQYVEENLDSLLQQIYENEAKLK